MLQTGQHIDQEFFQTVEPQTLTMPSHWSDIKQMDHGSSETLGVQPGVLKDILHLLPVIHVDYKTMLLFLIWLDCHSPLNYLILIIKDIYDLWNIKLHKIMDKLSIYLIKLKSFEKIENKDIHFKMNNIIRNR